VTGRRDVLLGIDLGTTNLKCVGVSADGRIEEWARVPVTSRIDGDVYEQDPEGWWDGLKRACELAREQGFDPERVAAVGLTGHMHGTVLVDADGRAVRPCLTWADTRAAAEAEELRERYGERFLQTTRNDVDVVFTAPKLLWIARHDPGALAETRSVLSAKDFLRGRLTGRWGTDRTDAAGTLLLDVATDEWSPELARAAGVDPDTVPSVAASAEIVGTVTQSAASLTGLPAGIPVVAGSGDIASAMLGAGAVNPGSVYVNVGTAAQVLTAYEGLDAPRRYWLADVSPAMSIHSGTVFGAGLAHTAVARFVLGTDTAPTGDAFSRLDAGAAEIPFGSEGLGFIPSLGDDEGAPGGDAGGVFVGTETSPLHRYRAVLEGIAVAIDSFVPDNREIVRVGGGIRKSRLWLSILATVLGVPVEVIGHDASPVGAAMLAGVGIGWFDSPADAAARCVRISRTVRPERVDELDAIKERFALAVAWEKNDREMNP